MAHIIQPTRSGRTGNSGGGDLEAQERDTRSAWEGVVKSVDNHDKDVLDGWKDELNNLLIFAGLFSAVVTAFVVASLSSLQDPADTSSQILAKISVQLSSLSVASGSIISTQVLPASQSQNSTATFEPSAQVIHINTLWIVSLTLSLIAAFFAITVQQWLRRIPLPSNLSAEQTVRLRHLRYDGLIFWQVPGIISFLPLLLQVAVVLFLSGVVLLLHSLNTRVALVFDAVFGTFMGLVLITTIIPFIRSRCPYKSPILPTLLMFLQWCTFPFALIAALSAFWVTLLYSIIYGLIFSSMPPLAGMFHTAIRIMRYTVSFGGHMIIDLNRFWRDREYRMLVSASDQMNAKALASACFASARHSLYHISRILQSLPLEITTRVILRWVALELGDCDYHRDLLDLERISPVDPRVLERMDQQFTQKFAKMILSSLPLTWHNDHLDSENGLRITSILILLNGMWKWTEPDSQRYFVKRLMMLQTSQTLIPTLNASSNPANLKELGLSERILSSLLYDYSVHVKYRFSRAETTDVLAWALQTNPSPPWAAARSRSSPKLDKGTLQTIELVLASTATAMFAIAQHPDVLEDRSSQVNKLLTSFKTFIEDYETHIKAIVKRSTDGAPECSILITSRALRTAAESLNTVLQIRGAEHIPVTSSSSNYSVLQQTLRSLEVHEGLPTLTPSRFKLSHAISNVQREIYNPPSQRPRAWRPSDYPTQADPPTAREAQ